jgi:MFS transporter, PHS family, inorganic phosphate transporter
MITSWLVRTVVAGAGFFADSYDLFITDGVTNILKNLGPTQTVKYSFSVDPICNATAPAVFPSYNVSNPGFQTMSGTAGYANFLCYSKDNQCLQTVWDNSVCGLIANPSADAEMLPRYQVQTVALKNSVNNAALIGSIFGQLFFGFVGDLMGRKWSFVITSLLIILGALGSATAAGGMVVAAGKTKWGLWDSNTYQPSSSMYDVYIQLCVWRGILGFGVGGEYPLSSTITSEASDSATRGRNVLTNFSMQGWGKLTAAIVNFSMISTIKHYGGPWIADGTWRFSLALGCVLNLVTIYQRFCIVESKIYNETKKKELGIEDAEAIVVVDKTGAKKVAVLDFWTTLKCLREYAIPLIGTASTWFLIDVTFYGQSLMNTSFVNNAVANTAGLNSVDKLRFSLLSTVYIMLIALPGYWFAIGLVEKMGRYWMTQMGFLMSAVCFAILSGAYNTDLRLSANGAGFVIIYGLTYFFANFGPNSTTFLMPVELYPTRIRTTGHGISAAMGKLGATAGSYGLLSMWYSYCTDAPTVGDCSTVSTSSSQVAQNESTNGAMAVMAVCVGVSLLGNVMTTLFVKETGFKTLEEVDAGCKTLEEFDKANAAAIAKVVPEEKENK